MFTVMTHVTALEDGQSSQGTFEPTTPALGHNKTPGDLLYHVLDVVRAVPTLYRHISLQYSFTRHLYDCTAMRDI